MLGFFARQSIKGDELKTPDQRSRNQPVKDLVERLMGKNPEHRFNFIQANAANLSEDEIDA